MRLRYNLDTITGITVPKGRCRARLTRIEETISKKKKPMLVWYWTVKTGESKGKELRSWTSLQDDALFSLKEHLEAFNFSGTVDVETRTLVGKSVTLLVGIRTVVDEHGRERSFSDIVALLPSAQAALKRRKKKRRRSLVEEEDEFEDEVEDEEEFEDEDEEEEDEFEDEDEDDEDYEDDEDDEEFEDDDDYED